LKIDGKPVFVIYRPFKVEQLDQMLDYWRECAYRIGLHGLYFMTMKQYNNPSLLNCLKSFDGVIRFQPFDAMSRFINADSGIGIKRKLKRRLPTKVRYRINKSLDGFRYHYKRRFSKPQIWDYDDIWQQIINDQPNPVENEIDNYSGIFVDWDNTPRYGRRSKVFHGASPGRFSYWLSKLDMQIREGGGNPMVFLNAWNEWAEGTYLEPDERYGFEYLEAIMKITSK
jgi:hypothetical protein